MRQGKATPTIHRQVNLPPAAEPHIKNVTVFFHIFDVGDPFNQLHADMPNVNVVDSNDGNGPLGNDNRGGGGGGNAGAGTDSNGQARATIRVSMQPGDNYRAVAALRTDVRSQATQAQADALNLKTDAWGNTVSNAGFSGYKAPVHWSPMLTVWRKLHVETDTMVRPTFSQNTYTMAWDEPRQGAVATQVVFEVNDPPAQGGGDSEQQFTGGIVELQDSNGVVIITKRIVDYKTDEGVFDDIDFKDEVTINIPDCGGGLSGLACLGGVSSGTATLSDDDLSVEAAFLAKTWGCDDLYSVPVASLAPPDLSVLVERYRPAYILPVHATDVSHVQGLVTFLRNQGFGAGSNYGKALWDQALAARNLPVSTADFWTVMVVSAWQPEEGSDFDPNAEAGSGFDGITWGINTHKDGQTTAIPVVLGVGLGPAYTGMCTVLKAVTGEVAGRERFTVAHEIGHTFGLPHNVFVEFDAEDVGIPIGLMDPTGDGHYLPFTAENVRRLRSYIQP